MNGYLLSGFLCPKNPPFKAGAPSSPALQGGVEHLRRIFMNLKAKNQVIRISLDMLDDEGYEKCIKGFIFISQGIISAEKKAYKIKDNLQDYFFNDKAIYLKHEKDFLLAQVKRACGKGKILDNVNNPVNSKELAELKKESHLLPFLEW